MLRNIVNHNLCRGRNDGKKNNMSKSRARNKQRLQIYLLISLCVFAWEYELNDDDSTDNRIINSILKNLTGTLLTEWIHFLAGETDQKAVFLLVLGDIFDDVRTCLRHGHSLNVGLTTQLIDHVTLLLQVVGDEVHYSCFRKSCKNTNATQTTLNANHDFFFNWFDSEQNR